MEISCLKKYYLNSNTYLQDFKKNIVSLEDILNKFI